MAPPRLAIRRFTISVAAPAGHGGAVARRAEAAVRTLLPERLDARLSPGEGDRVLLIRRIELDLGVTANDDAARIADGIAEAIAAGVARAANEPAAALAFDGPAAHVAAFLAALVDGGAWDRWWFRGFDGVRPLPVSAAARTVLLRDPALIPSVFAALPPDRRARLAAAVTAADAGLVLDALEAVDAAPPPDALWPALATALLGAGETPPAGCALAALMAVAAAWPAAIGGGVTTAARRATRLLTGSASMRRDSGAAATLPEPLHQALAASTADDRPAAAPAGWRYSPLGGHALLLAPLLALDLDTAVAGWPDEAGRRPGDLLRLLVLAAVAGPRLLDDPVWRDILGVPARLSCADLAAWIASVPDRSWRRLGGPAPPASPRSVALPAGLGGRPARAATARLARAALCDFARRLPGFATASAPFLRANLLGAGAAVRIEGDALHLRLDRPPLDVLLSITGMADRELVLPDGRRLRLERRR